MCKIGIDIGGTSVKGILVEGNNIIKTASSPTNAKSGRKGIETAMFSVIEQLMCDGVTLIGVSSAGNINPYTGVCVYATDNLPEWTDYPIKTSVEAKFKIPCVGDNDAICALKAEIANYNDCQNAVMITFGTGIGGAVLSGGKIIRGKNFDGGRLGHMILVPDGKKCNCGKTGCAEAYLSCTALNYEGKKLIPSLSGVKELFRLYESGNQNAVTVLKRFSFYLNIFLDNVRTAYAPEVIILGGGLSKDKEILLSLIDNKSDITFAKFGNNAGALGSLIKLY